MQQEILHLKGGTRKTLKRLNNMEELLIYFGCILVFCVMVLVAGFCTLFIEYVSNYGIKNNDR